MKGIYNKFWTVDQVATLIKMFPDNTNLKIAKVLGKKESAIIAKGFKLQLRKSKEFMLACSKKSCFKKGNQPMNKGRKLIEYCLPEAIKAIKAKQFIKGNEPHNTKHDGAITVRKDKSDTPFYHIRISKAKWEYLHRYNYKKFIGDIPSKHIVAFKNKDTLDCHPFNLELISMKDNVLRNSIQRFPQELKQNIRLLTKLKKQLKNYGKEQIS